jgi:Skp family chaperone for outer membrane proteins
VPHRLRQPDRRRAGTGRAAAAALLLGCLCAAAPVAAALYKWTDANGRVVYSDQPPPGDVKVDTLKAPPPPANPNAAKEMAAKEAEGKKQKLDAQEAAQKAEQQRADNTRRYTACRDAQAQMRQLAAEQVPLVKLNEKGETVHLDDTERRNKRTELEAWVRANCAPG